MYYSNISILNYSITFLNAQHGDVHSKIHVAVEADKVIKFHDNLVILNRHTTILMFNEMQYWNQRFQQHKNKDNSVIFITMNK